MHFLVLVLSETVLVLVPEKMMVSEPIFDHERIVFTRLNQRMESVAEGSIEYEYREAEYEYEESPNQELNAERRSDGFEMQTLLAATRPTLSL